MTCHYSSCCLCPPALSRHDRRKRIVLHPLHFQGTRSPVAWLEPELRQRGMLPGERSPEHGMPHEGVGGGGEGWPSVVGLVGQRVRVA